MSSVLVISGHPDLKQSYTNTVVISELEERLEDIEVRRLDELYPDYRIDVEAEHKALLEADVVVLQFPFYWYSMPALLKKWMDDVFTFNFAYGPEGDKLKGKDFFLSFTVGGPEESYSPLGYNHFSVEQMLRPIEQTAYLAGLNYHNPVYAHRMVYIPDVYNTLEDVQARAQDQANRLIERIREVTESDQSRIKKFIARWFREFDVLPEDSQFFTGHLSEQLNLQMPEGNFRGHSGFREWYAMARATFKPGCDHQVEQVEIKESESGYQLALRVRLIADSFDDSPLKGESLNMLVNEVWQVSLDNDGHVTIHDYQVVPVTHNEIK